MTESDIQQVLWLHLRDSGHTIVAPNFTPVGWWECDVFSVTEKGYVMEHEIKVSRADFQKDKQKGDKHELLAMGDARGPSSFYFVAPSGVLPIEIIPTWAGLREITERGRVVTVRPAPRLHRAKMADGTMLRIARSFCWRFWQLREGRSLWDLKRKEAA